jgi:hypothetical protein
MESKEIKKIIQQAQAEERILAKDDILVSGMNFNEKRRELSEKIEEKLKEINETDDQIAHYEAIHGKTNEKLGEKMVITKTKENEKYAEMTYEEYLGLIKKVERLIAEKNVLEATYDAIWRTNIKEKSEQLKEERQN